MSKSSLLAILSVFVLEAFVVPTTAAAQHSASDVRATERAWLDAYENSDPDAMRQIVADDFIITYPNGVQLNKEQTVAMVSRDPGDAPDSRMFTEKDTVRFFGQDVAVITGIFVQEVTLADGTVRRGQSMYTDTYRFMDGRWQVIASHLSRPPESE